MWLEWIDKGNVLPSPLSNVLLVLIPVVVFRWISDLCSGLTVSMSVLFVFNRIQSGFQ